MKDLKKGVQVEFEGKTYFLHRIVEMVAVTGKMQPRYLKEIADYPTDQLTFVESGPDTIRTNRFSCTLFEANQKLKKRLLTIIE